jgi:hypothetical protein
MKANSGEQDRLGDEQVVVEQVDEGFEQAAEPGLVDRGGRDDGVGRGEPLDRGLQRLGVDAGDGRAGDVDGERAELDDGHGGRCAGVLEAVEGLLGDAVGELPGR